MAGQQYGELSSPIHDRHGHSDASISLSPRGGSAPGSALEQTSGLLELPEPPPMPFDYSVIPRTISSSNDYPTRGSNNPYTPGIFLGGNSDHQQPASDNPAVQWSSHYSLQPGNTHAAAASAIPINRFQSEPQASWDPLRLAPPPGPIRGRTHAQQKPARRPASNNRLSPGPASDQISHTNETDEGYYTNSQLDAQSVHSMNNVWNMNQDRQNIQAREMLAPSAYSQPGPENTSSDQPPSDLRYQKPVHNDVNLSQQRSHPLACGHKGCDHRSKTQSDFKKHAARHNKEHVCREQGCARTQGFATINDLERHQKSVHGIQPEHGHSREYKCFGESCPKRDKEWPRFDNFKQHLKRMHPHENIDTLILKSKEWYEKYKKPTAPPETTRAVQRPSSSSSPQASAQNAGPTRAQYLMPGQWNARGTTNQVRAVNTGSSRNFVGSYAQSEAGCYSTKTGHVESQPNLTPGTALGCSQSFIAADLLRDHLPFQHGLQNVSTLAYTGMQNQPPSWLRSEGTPGNQHARIRREVVQGQRYSSNVSPGQALSQAPMRPLHAGYSSQTAPNPSISALPHRLNEDFENYGMTQPQEELIGLGGSENDLAHIGAAGQFLASESHTTNIGSDTSQEQGPNLHEDHQGEQGSSLTAEDIREFLQKHFTNEKLDLATLAIQGTLQSLQSAPLTGGLSNTSPSTSAPDTDNFRSSTRDGKTVYHCSYSGCKKDMPRKCELRKHFKRHTLPWACTVDKCPKAFGSKNDWTRHESKQHEQQECWRCGEADANESGESVPASGADACKRVFYTKDLFSKHLRQTHKFNNSVAINRMCEKQRIGQRYQVQFWCGFCRRVVPLKQIGVPGEAERYSHIDNHFSKEKRDIDQWEPLNGRPSEGESALAAEQTSPTESCSSGSNEEEAGEGASESTAIQRASRKRPSSTMVSGNQGPAPKRAHTARTAMVRCCACTDIFQRWNGGCVRCNHRICRNCPAEAVEHTEQILNGVMQV